jgi:hypothetical protein
MGSYIHQAKRSIIRQSSGCPERHKPLPLGRSLRDCSGYCVLYHLEHFDLPTMRTFRGFLESACAIMDSHSQLSVHRRRCERLDQYHRIYHLGFHRVHASHDTTVEATDVYEAKSSTQCCLCRGSLGMHRWSHTNLLLLNAILWLV